eukprot:sb/3466327/
MLSNELLSVLSTDPKRSHEDTIHDIQFNWFGDMMATCSSDHKVKIWKKIGDMWSVVKELPGHIAPGHIAPVWRMSWAHPDYGVLLATCSMDSRAIIWRMANDDVTEWTKKVLMDSVTPVIDVKFAPRTWSSADMSPGKPDMLLLATCCDKAVFFYIVEPNPHLNDTDGNRLSQYTIEEHAGNISCLAWNSLSDFSQLVLAVGFSSDKGLSRIDLYSFEDSPTPNSDQVSKNKTRIMTLRLNSKLQHMAFRPNNGSRRNVLAVATEHKLLVYKLYSDEEIPPESDGVESFKDDVKQVSWDIFGTQILTMFSNGTLKTFSWKYKPQRQWASRELVSRKELDQCIRD